MSNNLLSQQMVADKYGVTLSAISQWKKRWGFPEPGVKFSPRIYFWTPEQLEEFEKGSGKNLYAFRDSHKTRRPHKSVTSRNGKVIEQSGQEVGEE